MLKVLSIEDDAGILAVLQSVLRSAKIDGLQFQYANTLDSGVEMVKSFLPDVILLDLKLPSGDGKGWSDGAHTLSLVPELSEFAPVIIVSGFAEEYFAQAIEMGASDCIPKSLLLSTHPGAVLAHLIALALAHWKKRYAAEIH